MLHILQPLSSEPMLDPRLAVAAVYSLVVVVYVGLYLWHTRC